jgi:hypothetical protein
VPAGAITASTRYYRPGLTQVNYTPAIANKAAPTRAEINAGTNLSPETNAIDGWQPQSNFLDAPDLVSAFVPKVAGSVEAGDSSLTLYASSNSVDVRTLLPRGTVGFILMLDESDTAGRKMDVYPVTVGSQAKIRDIGDVAKIQINFAITSAPAENVTIPA